MSKGELQFRNRPVGAALPQPAPPAPETSPNVLGRSWLAFVLALVLLHPIPLLARPRSPASPLAHPRLARAVPAAGAELTSAPVELRLTFTEVPELAFTQLVLLGPSGDTVTLSVPVHAADDDYTVVAAIAGALEPGQLTVVWQTAGPDGHPIRGRYRFTVAIADTTGSTGVRRGEPGAGVLAPRQGPPPAAHHPADAASSKGFGAESPLFALIRWVLYAGLLVIVGAVVFHRVVLARVRRAGGAADIHIGRTASSGAARLGLVGSGAVLLSAAARLLAQSYAVHGAVRMLEPGLILSMLARTVWGWGWLLQLGGAVVALASFAAARKHQANGWVGAGLAALILCFTPALSGHAVSAEEWVPVAVLADGLHVLGAGGWIGTLLIVVTVGLPVASRLEPSERGPAAAGLINAFSPVALAAAGLLAVTGLLTAWVQLGTLSALWQTGYGRTLLLKLGVLAIVAGTGAYNWRWVRPALGDEISARRIQRSAAVELFVASIVLAITAFLVAVPTPRSM